VTAFQIISHVPDFQFYCGEHELELIDEIMKKQAVINCSFDSWYPRFKRLTIPSVVLKVPKVFIQYLLTDGVYLPETSQPHSRRANGSATEEESDDETEWDDEDDSNDPSSPGYKSKKLLESDEMKQFEQHISAVIADLGGTVFPKLTWSSPKDARWIAANNVLSCQSFYEICLLFKSSEFITHDITDPFQYCDDQNNEDYPEMTHILVLREWYAITPSGEFRVFIRDSRVIAISSRHQQYYAHILTDKIRIVDSIQSFYKRHIKNSYPDSSVVMDLYLPGQDRRPVLVDFNPYCETTDGLMFTWMELTDQKFPSNSEEGELLDGTIFRAITHEGKQWLKAYQSSFSDSLDLRSVANS